MKTQKAIWQREHEENSGLPSMHSEEPSSAVTYFADQFEKLGLRKGAKIIDIGCGKGRNIIYLAKLGFEMYAMDYIETAANHVKKIAEKNNLEKVHVQVAEINNTWPFADNFLDVAVDCFSSIDIETLQGREKCKNEMLRTLKSGGYAFVAVVSASDEFESKYIALSPGPEKNSVLWPITGKFQKDYDEAELMEFYKEFKIIEIKEMKKPAEKMGEKFTATNYLLVLQKN